MRLFASLLRLFIRFPLPFRQLVPNEMAASELSGKLAGPIWRYRKIPMADLPAGGIDRRAVDLAFSFGGGNRYLSAMSACECR